MGSSTAPPNRGEKEKQLPPNGEWEGSTTHRRDGKNSPTLPPPPPWRWCVPPLPESCGPLLLLVMLPFTSFWVVLRSFPSFVKGPLVHSPLLGGAAWFPLSFGVVLLPSLLLLSSGVFSPSLRCREKQPYPKERRKHSSTRKGRGIAAQPKRRKGENSTIKRRRREAAPHKTRGEEEGTTAQKK